MRDSDQDPTPTRTAVTPLDYAAPGPWRMSWGTERALEACVVVAIIVLLVAILMPSHGGNRRGAERVACAANLRSVGQAIQMYANDHVGDFPDTLEHVVAGGYVPDVRIFLCPCSTNTDTPAQGATRAAIAADLTTGGHLSYAYVGRGLTVKAGSDTVIAYEHATHHEGKGGNVLFADGHVVWHSTAELRAVIDWYAAGKGPMIKAGGAALLRPATRAAMQPVGRPAP